jgi:hypothetical protein
MKNFFESKKIFVDAVAAKQSSGFASNAKNSGGNKPQLR